MIKIELFGHLGHQVHESNGKETFVEWLNNFCPELLDSRRFHLKVIRRYGSDYMWEKSAWHKNRMENSTCKHILVTITEIQTKEAPAMSNPKKPEQHIHLIYGVDILTASKPELMTLATEICDKIDSLRNTRERIPSTYIAKQIEDRQELLAKVIAKLDE